MAEEDEFRCFVGGLSWSTTDRSLEMAFRTFGSILEAKVVFDRDTNRSRGFGFVTFKNEDAMDRAIEKMHNQELDGRTITVSKAQPKSASGGARDDRYRDSDRGDRSTRGGASGECFKCGGRGHWARDCPNGGGGYRSRGRYGDRDRYGDGGRYGDAGRYGSDGGRYGDGGKYGGDGSRGSGGRYGDRYSSRENGRRSGPYDRPSGRSDRYDRY